MDQDYVNELPDELLLHIMSYLEIVDCEAPSVRKFAEEPSFELTTSESTPLKDFALVCRRWRNLVLPDLFRYSRLQLDDEPRWIFMDVAPLLDWMKRQPGDRSDNEERIFRRLELLAGSGMPVTSGSHSTIQLEYIQDDDCLLLSAPDDLRCWIPSSRFQRQSFVDFISQHGLESQVTSLVVYTHRAVPTKCTDSVWNVMNTECRTHWEDVFSTLNPKRVVVAAPPTTVEVLTESPMGTQDAWAFDMRMHYVEFRRDGSHVNTTAACVRPGETGHRSHTCLHNIRPWTHMGYNEGSYLPAYSMYEAQ